MRRRLDDEIEADPVIELILAFAVVGILGTGCLFAYGAARILWSPAPNVIGARAFSGCVCVEAQEESQ